MHDDSTDEHTYLFYKFDLHYIIIIIIMGLESVSASEDVIGDLNIISLVCSND